MTKYISAAALAAIVVLALGAGAWFWLIKPPVDRLTANEGEKLHAGVQDTRASARQLGASFRQLIPQTVPVSQTPDNSPAAARSTTSGQTPGQPPPTGPTAHQYQTAREKAFQVFNQPPRNSASPPRAAAPGNPEVPEHPAAPAAVADSAGAAPGTPGAAAAGAADTRPAEPDPMRHQSKAIRDAETLRRELAEKNPYASDFVREVRVIEQNWTARYNAAMDDYDDFKARIKTVDRQASDYFKVQHRLIADLHNPERAQRLRARIAREFKTYQDWRGQVRRTEATADRIRLDLEDINTEFKSLNLSAHFNQITESFINLPVSMQLLNEDLREFEKQHDKLVTEFLSSRS